MLDEMRMKLVAERIHRQAWNYCVEFEGIEHKSKYGNGVSPPFSYDELIATIEEEFIHLKRDEDFTFWEDRCTVIFLNEDHAMQCWLKFCK